MKRPIIDQLAHMLTAIAALAPFALEPSWFTGAWAGLCMGMVRELTEEGEISIDALDAVFTSPGSRLDVLFWMIGGCVAGALS